MDGFIYFLLIRYIKYKKDLNEKDFAKEIREVTIKI